MRDVCDALRVKKDGAAPSGTEPDGALLTDDPADAFDEIVARLTAEEKGLEDKGPPIAWPALLTAFPMSC